MNSIRLKLNKAENRLPIGSSKFFGTPDVWKDFTWPTVEADGELYDMEFMCQINCADLSHCDVDNLLPKTGMLYFFYDIEQMPWEPSAKNAAKVLYYDGELSELRECVVTDEDGTPEPAISELAISPTVVAAGFLSDCEDTHLLLGVPSLDYGTISDKIQSWQMLLQIDSMETDDVCLNFTSDGILCYFIEPEKLKNKDFSDVRIQQIYS